VARGAAAAKSAQRSFFGASETSNAVPSKFRERENIVRPMRESPDYRRFCDSLSDRTPPTDLSAELAALWWARNDDWDRAHQIVQALDSAAAAHVHAYLHRVEGDLDNADYWYARAAAHRTDEPLSKEWEVLTKQLLNQASAA
jgi:hypothetical protein